ncbi:MAG: hypothetical protein, partial [Olavius algarvensis Gamma 3 endosymbiont]
ETGSRGSGNFWRPGRRRKIGGIALYLLFRGRQRKQGFLGYYQSGTQFLRRADSIQI